jgi:CheY-like chemotaxis protein
LTPPPPPRVLVAEDNPVAQRVAVAMLVELGCRVDAVANGQAAVEQAARETYALVLMDCEMPGMDGYEAARRIRAEEKRHTPIVALSAHSAAEHRRRSLEAGMDDHAVKPFSLAMLRGLVEQWTSPGGTAAPPPAEPRAVDSSVLAELRAISPRIATETVEQFLASSPRALAALAEAMRAGDAPGTARAAHGLVGSAGLVGALALQEAARAVERTARAGHVDPSELSAIEREHGRACAALAETAPAAGGGR